MFHPAHSFLKKPGKITLLSLSIPSTFAAIPTVF